MANIPVNASNGVVVVDVVVNGQVIFDFDFRADEVGDLKAIYRPVNGVELDLQGGIDFTATGLETEDGGTITLTSFTTTIAGSKIAIYRDIEIQRENDYQRDVFADDLNREQDKIFMILQELERDISSSVRVQPGQTPPDLPTLLASIQAALAAAAAAIGAANSQFDFSTEAAFASASIPEVVVFIRTAGYYSAGDGGGHLKKRIASPSAVKPWHKQSADGAWWELAQGQEIHVEMFGAVRRTATELVALNGSASLDADEAKNEAAFQAANDFIEAKGGGTFYGKGNVYLFGSKGWRYSRAVFFQGAGHGKWMPSFPTEVKTWEGTNLVARRAGTKDYIARGITSGELSGGWRTSLDTPARKFKISSFMNRDAVGAAAATPKAMAVFIGPKARSQDRGGIKSCRVVPWIGTDGISTYSTQVGNDLGANWDIGVLLDTVEGFHVEGVQVRGYWRMVGLAEVSPDFEGWSRSEANVIQDSSATGFVGMMVRSGTQYRVMNTSWNGTTGTIEVPWDAENPFPSAGGQINLINSGYVQYTSTSRNGGNLVFNGLTVNPAGNTYLRNPYRGTGFSTGAFVNVEAWALWHHSGQKAEALGFDRPSTGFECSGFPMRGLNFFNFSAFGEDTISPAMHLHNCFDFNFTGGKAEIGLVLASPIEASQELPTTAAGSTNNLRLIGFQFASSIDSRFGYWNPRSIMDLQRQWNDVNDLTSATMLLKALEGQEFWLKMAASKNFRIKKSDDADALTIFASGNATLAGQLTLGDPASNAFLNSQVGRSILLREGTSLAFQIDATTRHLRPGADNVQNIGSNANRLANVFSGIITLIDGVASPATIAGHAQIYVDSADGDLKIKFGDGVVKTIVIDT